MRRTAVAILAVLLAVSLAWAQEPQKVPVLTTEERQAIVIAAQTVEIAELRLAAARAELGRLLAGAQREGYELTQLLEYVPVKQKPATPGGER